VKRGPASNGIVVAVLLYAACNPPGPADSPSPSPGAQHSGGSAAALGAWLSERAEDDARLPKLRRGFEAALGRPPFSVARIANPLPRDNPATPTIDEAGTYYESCPDGVATAAGPACYPVIPEGGGFYTISTDVGGARQAVRIASNQTFVPPTLSNPEPNPFFFHWLRSASQPVSALLEIDDTAWRNARTPNIYVGLQFNTPRARPYYFGGSDLENEYMHTDRGFTELQLRASTERGPRDDAAQARILAGIVWSSPSTGQSYDIEINLDAMGPRSSAPSPPWSTLAPVAYNTRHTSAGGSGQYLYLGGSAWGLPPLVEANDFVEVRIPWRYVIQKLLERGDLRAESLSDRPARPLTFVVGVEQLGRLHTELEIRSLEMFDIVP